MVRLPYQVRDINFCMCLLLGALVTLSLSDDDFGKLATGKANAQKLFMSGKLKIKGKISTPLIEADKLTGSGNVMKATAVEPIFKKVQGKAKL